MSNFATLRDELLAEIETIAPVVREYASQSEQLGRLAELIIKAARKTSLLRFICAHELGGCEADPLTVMEVSEALSRIDGFGRLDLGDHRQCDCGSWCVSPRRIGAPGVWRWRTDHRRRAPAAK